MARKYNNIIKEEKSYNKTIGSLVVIGFYTISSNKQVYIIHMIGNWDK